MSNKRVRTLLRVSSKQQLHDDDIPLQRSETLKFIRKHDDWVFDMEYVEKAVSAYKNRPEEREVLQLILEDAKNNEFDILLTYMSDRIGRQEEYSLYVGTLTSLGVQVWTVKDGQLKTDDHIDKLLNYIRFWQNEGESKKTSARVRDAQIEMVKSGRFVGGSAPYGYKLINSGMVSNHGRLLKQLVIVPEQAEIVRYIYSLAINKGYGAMRITRELNRKGIHAPINKEWSISTVYKILKNPIYMGYYSINRRRKSKSGKGDSFNKRDKWILSDEQIPELVIISKEDWEKAQLIREYRDSVINKLSAETHKMFEEQYKTPFNSKGKLLLSGMLYCGYCGKKLKNTSYMNKWTTKKGEVHSRYIGRYGCREEACTSRATYNRELIEEPVVSIVEQYIENIRDLDVTSEIKSIKNKLGGNIENEIKRLDREIVKCEKDISTLEESIPEALRGEGSFTVETLSSLITNKKQKLLELREQKKELKLKEIDSLAVRKQLDELTCLAVNWKEVFQQADDSEKKMLLSAIIDHVEVKDGEITIKFKFNPETL